MASYPGVVNITKDLKGCKNNTVCDAFRINPISKTAISPKINVTGNGNIVQHEASLLKTSEEQIFYMQQRDISEA
jgi:Fe-S cluster assembly protein SufB